MKKKEMDEEKRLEVARKTLAVVDLIRFRGNVLEMPLIDGTWERFPEFFGPDDGQAFAGVNIPAMVQTAAKHKLLNIEHSDASIGGAGFDDILIPTDFETLLARFVIGTRKRMGKKPERKQMDLFE